MALKELDHFLRELTPSEVRARETYLSTGINPVMNALNCNKIISLTSLTEPLNDPEFIMRSEETFELQTGPFHIRRKERFMNFPNHLHDYFEMIYVYDGSCVQEINADKIIMNSGDVCILDMNSRHSLRAMGENDITISFMFKPSFFHYRFYEALGSNDLIASFFMKSLSEKCDEACYLLFRKSDKTWVNVIAQRIISEYFDADICTVEALVNLIQLLFVELLRGYRDNNGVTLQNIGHRTDVINILTYIKRHYASCTVDDVANYFGYSPKYLSKLLKKSIGFDFTELRLDYRMQSAAKMLHLSELPVSEVAYKVGFSNTSYFYRVFKQRFGKTPQEYRDAVGKEKIAQ